MLVVVMGGLQDVLAGSLCIGVLLLILHTRRKEDEGEGEGEGGAAFGSISCHDDRYPLFYFLR